MWKIIQILFLLSLTHGIVNSSEVEADVARAAGMDGELEGALYLWKRADHLRRNINEDLVISIATRFCGEKDPLVRSALKNVIFICKDSWSSEASAIIYQAYIDGLISENEFSAIVAWSPDGQLPDPGALVAIRAVSSLEDANSHTNRQTLIEALFRLGATWESVNPHSRNVAMGILNGKYIFTGGYERSIARSHLGLPANLGDISE